MTFFLYAASVAGASEDPVGEQRPCVPPLRALHSSHQTVPLPESAEECDQLSVPGPSPHLLHFLHPPGQVQAVAES